MKIKVNYAVICDEIRREDNGKLILIGVYGRDIGVASMPATLVLAAGLSLITEEAGEIKLDFKWEYGGKAVAEGKGNIAIPEPGAGLIAIPALPIHDLTEPGTIEFKVRFEDQDWETAGTLPVVNRSTIASAPPS